MLTFMFYTLCITVSVCVVDCSMVIYFISAKMLREILVYHFTSEQIETVQKLFNLLRYCCFLVSRRNKQNPSQHPLVANTFWIESGGKKGRKEQGRRKEKKSLFVLFTILQLPLVYLSRKSRLTIVKKEKNVIFIYFILSFENIHWQYGPINVLF